MVGKDIKRFGTIKYAIRALGTLYALNYELSGRTMHSSFFAYVSGDKLIGQTGGLVWDRMISLSSEQEKAIKKHNECLLEGKIDSFPYIKKQKRSKHAILKE